MDFCSTQRPREKKLFSVTNFYFIYLVIVNFLVLIVSSVNLLLAASSSGRLIKDYNGAIVYTPLAKIALLAVNAIFMLTSLQVLISLLLLKDQLKIRWIRYYMLVEFALAFLFFALLVTVWFWPIRLDLNHKVGLMDWRNLIQSYSYDHELDNNGLYPNDDQYQYTSPIDRFQQMLHCCGIEEPTDWLRYHGQFSSLYPPSCCHRPQIGRPFQKRSNLRSSVIFFCDRSDYPLGCRTLLIDREQISNFNLRMLSLFLITLLLMNSLFGYGLIDRIITKKINNNEDNFNNVGNHSDKHTASPTSSYGVDNRARNMVLSTLITSTPRRQPIIKI